MKKCSRLVQEKAVLEEENLKARRKKKEKNRIETETTLSWKVAFKIFFNTEEFCLLTLGKVGEEFTETSEIWQILVFFSARSGFGSSQ